MQVWKDAGEEEQPPLVLLVLPWFDYRSRLVLANRSGRLSCLRMKRVAWKSVGMYKRFTSLAAQF